MKILVAEDEKLLRMNLLDSLQEVGYDTVEAGDGSTAWRLIGEELPQLVVADVRMPGLDGMELLRRVRGAFPGMEVLIMTTYASVKDAVAALKAGAADYLVKPFEMEEFLERVAHVVEVVHLRQKTDDLERRIQQLSGSTVFLGVAPAMKELWGLVNRVAGQNVDVLLEGETGVGKEVVARVLHEQSGRASKPFVPISFVGLPPSLIESELFGHEKGAFTGADQARPGRFEASKGGTLFLDDADDIPLEMQGKLLRVLQERRVERLGSNTSIPVDFRLVVACKQDLIKMVDAGSFRLDLFHRLHVVHFTIPPLRERREDILPLVGFFMKKFSEASGCAAPSLHPDVAAHLQSYDWPGNVRELQHIIQAALALCDGPLILPGHLPEETRRSKPSPPWIVPTPSGPTRLDDILRETERRLLLWAMEETKGNQSAAASLLGLARSTFQNRWHKVAGREDS